MKRALYLSITVLMLLTIGASAYAGKIYRWQDEKGTWHYSATPPTEQTAETINIKAPPTSGPSNTGSSNSESSNSAASNSEASDAESSTTGKQAKSSETDETDGNQPSEADKTFKKSAEVEAEDKQLARENCENARKNLANLTNHRRLRINDEETGEVRYLGNDEHDEWMKRSQEEVAKFCQ